MKSSRKARLILLFEILGFSAIIILSWMDELFNLPDIIFGMDNAGIHYWHEAILETVIIVAVAVPVIAMTAVIARRLFYLEKFMRVCAWCRKIEVEGKWMSIEEFFAKGFDAQTSHGICPACAEKIKHGEMPGR